jgi:4-hydroxyphenylacetate 3-monooxygenase
MIRTGEQYKDSIRDGREIHINGEKVKDVTTHPQFKPLVDIRARIYDMQHDAATRDVMTVVQDGEVNAIGNALPYSQDDWWAKRRATDTVLETVGGVVTRVGDETVGEMWSLYDGQDVLSRDRPAVGEEYRERTFIR